MSWRNVAVAGLALATFVAAHSATHLIPSLAAREEFLGASAVVGALAGMFMPFTKRRGSWLVVYGLAQQAWGTSLAASVQCEPCIENAPCPPCIPWGAVVAWGFGVCALSCALVSWLASRRERRLATR